MMESYRAHAEAALKAYSAGEGLAPILAESMRYGLLDGGKRIRPCLLLCTAEMLGADPETTLPFACALEMIHCYSLIHDDLPAMDNDDSRRGKPSTHKQFGEANGILAGDGLLTAAALLLSKQPGHDAAKTAILSAALDMVSGQSYDLNASDRSEAFLRELHRQKTGALFRAATEAAANLADRNDLMPAFAALGETIGMLFQITDDLLDAERDRAEDKLTFVTFYGEDGARAFAAEAERSALATLADFDGAAADELRQLIRALTCRTE
ncbi:MAG: polyprenyl synthetase family protein [Clostridia bacterium]|nr:polyprenyl synthetase family protein [Clostridia bacterium]